MKIITFFTIILVTQSLSISGIVFPGPCPDFKTVDYMFECSSNITLGSYRVAAYLPVDGTTLNMFFNPFVSINCLDLQIQCSYADSRDIQLRLNCYPTMAGNKTTGIVTQCLPITFDPYRNMYKSNQIST